MSSAPDGEKPDASSLLVSRWIFDVRDRANARKRKSQRLLSLHCGVYCIIWPLGDTLNTWRVFFEPSVKVYRVGIFELSGHGIMFHRSLSHFAF